MKSLAQPIVGITLAILAMHTESTLAEPTLLHSSNTNIMAVDPNNGDVYITGRCGRFGQCGPHLTSDYNNVLTFNGMTGIQQVHTNALRTFYLSRNGNVYTTGGRTDYQPRKLEFHNKVIDMTSSSASYGKKHYFIVREGVYSVDGKTFEMGSLWFWDENVSTTPVQVGDRTDYIMISAGMWNIAVLNKNGDLWSWGGNTLSYGDGYFDIEKRNGPLLEPTVSGHKFRFVSVGGNHMAAIDMQDRVWTWGSDADGKMCNGSAGEAYIPTLSLLENVKQVGSGRAATSAITNDGKFLTCGWHNLIYQGTGYNRDQYPKTVAFTDATPSMLARGEYANSAFMDSTGLVWDWGGDSYGRLGNGGSNVETHQVGPTLRRKTVEPIALLDDVYWEPMIDDSLTVSSGKDKEKCNASSNNGKGGNYEKTGMCDNGKGTANTEAKTQANLGMRADGRGFQRSRK